MRKPLPQPQMGSQPVEFDEKTGRYTVFGGTTKYEIEPSDGQYMRLRRTNTGGVQETYYPRVMFEAFADRYMANRLLEVVRSRGK